MTEREAIVSWLREEWAWQRDESIKAAKCETLGRLRAAVFHAERAETLMYLISAIECGDHIRETEDGE